MYVRTMLRTWESCHASDQCNADAEEEVGVWYVMYNRGQLDADVVRSPLEVGAPADRVRC